MHEEMVEQHAVIDTLSAKIDLVQRTTQECVYPNIQEDNCLMIA